MEKSWILPGVAGAGGLVGLLARRFYFTQGYPPGGEVPLEGSPWPWVMGGVALAVLAALVLLSRGEHRVFDRCYTGAFYSKSKLILTATMASVVLFALGGFLAFRQGRVALADDSLANVMGAMRFLPQVWMVLGALSLLAAAGIFFVSKTMARGRPVLTAWAVTPAFACAFLVMANYYNGWATDPVLSRYVIPLAGTVLSMVACGLLAGFAFEKGRVAVTLVVCLMAAALDIMSLGDGLLLADVALLLALVFYLLAMAAALVKNDGEKGKPVCAPHCPDCTGCAPMGTLPPKPDKKKKKGQQEQAPQTPPPGGCSPEACQGCPGCAPEEPKN